MLTLPPKMKDDLYRYIHKALTTTKLELEEEDRAYFGRHGEPSPAIEAELAKVRQELAELEAQKSQVCSHGGRRPGAGRKPKGYKLVSIRMTDEEKIAVKKFLTELRKEKNYD